MKKVLLLVIALLSLAPAVRASEGGFAWDRFPMERTTDMAALQRGARLFSNYCLNCHSASLARYNRMADIGLSEDQIRNNLIFTGAKVGEPMKAAIDPKQAKEWFGAAPPDLSVITRSRSAAGQGSGADYVYTYLRSYYRDPARPTGWNNLAFPNVGMPNVLWQLQGTQHPVYGEMESEHGNGKAEVFRGFEQTAPGTMTPEQFNESVADLVAYLQWVGEPSQARRERIGAWVLLFLGVLTVFAWRLNAAYWKDVA